MFNFFKKLKIKLFAILFIGGSDPVFANPYNKAIEDLSVMAKGHKSFDHCENKKAIDEIIRSTFSVAYTTITGFVYRKADSEEKIDFKFIEELRELSKRAIVNAWKETGIFSDESLCKFMAEKISQSVSLLIWGEIKKGFPYSGGYAL